MNKKAILSDLTEGLEQLQEIIKAIKDNPEYGIEEYRIEMGPLSPLKHRLERSRCN